MGCQVRQNDEGFVGLKVREPGYTRVYLVQFLHIPGLFLRCLVQISSFPTQILVPSCF